MTSRCAYLIPTANPQLCGECFAAWRDMGWDTYALLDGDMRSATVANATGRFDVPEYKGWSSSFNFMASMLAGKYDWLATGGDDVMPCATHTASDIAASLAEHFSDTTMGVCQGTADGWAWDKNGTANPICYAPIVGSEFCRRWNGGQGAMWGGYHSYFADNELHDTASMYGLLWARSDLMLEHRHPAKVGKPTPAYKVSKQPLWQADADLYNARKKEGFPNHEPRI